MSLNMYFLNKIHCIYPIKHKDNSENSLSDEKEYYEQIKYFIKYILNDDNYDKLMIFNNS